MKESMLLLQHSDDNSDDDHDIDGTDGIGGDSRDMTVKVVVSV